ncbi:hypothetical protein C6Q13_05360 [Burkholderia gladioli]|nr:hypothetical protein C6Q13_05360 [Burkholderia gladioli]
MLSAVPGSVAAVVRRTGQPVREGEKRGGNRRAIAWIAALQQANGRQKKPGRSLPRSNNDKRRMVTRLQSNSRVP